MTCGACVATIESYVPNAVEGVLSISVGLLAERAEVVYDKRRTTPQDIAAAIEDVGFQAQLLLEVLFFKIILRIFYFNLFQFLLKYFIKPVLNSRP
jgi:copper chaperone CopZ